jgi:ABC-type nickel/cobalt efflux system permease component RcnA
VSFLAANQTAYDGIHGIPGCSPYRVAPYGFSLRIETCAMISFLSIIAVGFVLGMRHATDPDHVIAVTTIVSNQRNSMRAALIGAFWGLGHTLTIFVVGAGIILFNLVIPVRVGLSMELSVAVMLIVLGLINVRSFLHSMPVPSTTNHDEGKIIHSHSHSHGDYVHNHPHAHQPEAHPHPPTQTPLAWLDRVFGKVIGYQYVRPLVVGIVHGLAGSAAVALLVLTTIRDAHWAIAYLLVFGVGTIAGMMVITMGLASTFRVVSGRRRSISRELTMASGVLSVAFGLLVAYQICVVSGLFTAHARWTPH